LNMRHETHNSKHENRAEISGREQKMDILNGICFH